MKLENKVSIHNRFEIHVVRDGKIIQKGFAENILLDSIYPRLQANSAFASNIRFGTGTGIVSPERTSLFSDLGYKAIQVVEVVYGHPVSKAVRRIQINPEEFVGQTFTEIGLAHSTSESSLVTHALIKDSEGNPISLLKTSLDVLYIYATVFATVSLAEGLELYSLTNNFIIRTALGYGATRPPIIAGYSTQTDPKIASGNSLTQMSGGPHSQITPTYDTSVPRTLSAYARIPVEVLNIGRSINTLAHGTRGRPNETTISGVVVHDLKSTELVASYEFFNVEIGVGDGTKTVFPIDFPLYEDLVLKKDGVVLSSGFTEKKSLLYLNPIDFIDADSLPENIPAYYYGTSYREVLSNTTFKLKEPKNLLGFHIFSRAETTQTAGSPSATLQGSLDNGVTWQTLLASSINSVSFDTEIPITLDGVLTHIRIGSSAYFGCLYLLLQESPEENAVVFDVPPEENSVITADYKIKNLPKTTDYVVDVTFTYVFGEGV